jgi:hypothetical protein
LGGQSLAVFVQGVVGPLGHQLGQPFQDGARRQAAAPAAVGPRLNRAALAVKAQEVAHKGQVDQKPGGQLTLTTLPALPSVQHPLAQVQRIRLHAPPTLAVNVVYATEKCCKHGYDGSQLLLCFGRLLSEPFHPSAQPALIFLQVLNSRGGFLQDASLLDKGLSRFARDRLGTIFGSAQPQHGSEQNLSPMIGLPSDPTRRLLDSVKRMPFV